MTHMQCINAEKSVFIILLEDSTQIRNLELTYKLWDFISSFLFWERVCYYVGTEIERHEVYFKVLKYCTYSSQLHAYLWTDNYGTFKMPCYSDEH